MTKLYISSLSSKGFSDFQEQIERYKKKLKRGTEKGLLELAKLGKEVAIKEGSQISTNLIQNNVDYEKKSDFKYVLKTTNPLLTLLECGTGLIGEQSGSKTADIIGYKYRIGSKIKVYTLKFNGINQEVEGWFYYDENLGKIRFTQGMPSRPFFSNTADFLRKIAPQYVADKIKEEKL